MRYQFLCPHHSQWLSDNPSTAINCYHTTLDTGHYFKESGDLASATGYFGCAAETADILLQASAQKDRLTAIKRLVGSSLSLAACLQQTSNCTQAERVVQQLFSKLTTELVLPVLAKEQKQQVFILLQSLPTSPHKAVC